MDSEDESTQGIVSGSCIVVPYRDREEHLKKFVLHYSKVAQDVPIYVIEQNDDKPFNRAKLFNVAYLILQSNYNNFIFHDVDLIIDTKKSNVDEAYAHTESVVHTGTNLGQFGYRMPTKDFFGGVSIFHSSLMDEIQGWSNLIWGWGNEEEMVQEDLIKRGIRIERRQTYYHSLPHGHEYISMALLKESSKIRRDGKNNDIDGLSHCEYTITGITPFENHTLIKVTL